jgi:hypothetical protein
MFKSMQYVKSVDGVSEPIVNKVNQTVDENSLIDTGRFENRSQSQSVWTYIDLLPYHLP